ncbi:MAG: DUF559 domain-containing protein [Actinomycetota bacterium]
MGKDTSAADDLAARQHGTIARRQALAVGLTDKVIARLVRQGHWRKAEIAVYVIAGSPTTFEQRAMVAVLGEQERAVVSHLAAGFLHGLVTVKPGRIDVTVPFTSYHGRRPRKVVHCARALDQSDVRRARGIPVTCVTRTLVDLAGVTDDDQLQHALDTALNQGLITISVLEKYIDDRNLRHLKRVGRLRRFMNDRKDGVLGSGLERKFRRILRPRRIPQPKRQGGVGDYWVDFIFEEFGVFVEIDGDWHGTVAQLRKDARRQNQIVLAGFVPLRFTEDRLDHEPDAVCDEVEAALRAKGWRPRRRRKR